MMRAKSLKMDNGQIQMEQMSDDLTPISTDHTLEVNIDFFIAPGP